MNDGLRYTLVGLFVVLLGAGVVVTSLWLLTDQGGEHAYRTYVVYTSESVAGLNPLAPVRYRGVKVGRVREIGLDPQDPGRVRLLLDIDSRVPIGVGTQATLALQGITGLAYVELAGAPKGAPPLRPAKGAAYPEIPSRPSRLLRLESAVTEALAQLRDVGRDLHGVATRLERILAEPNRRALAAILVHLRDFSAFLADPDLHGDLRRLARASVADAEALPGLIAEARKTLVGVRPPLADFGRASRRVAQAADHLGRAGDRLAEAGTGAGRAWGAFLARLEARLSPFVDRFDAMVGSLQRLADDIDRDPARLIRGGPRLPPGPGEGR